MKKILSVSLILTLLLGVICIFPVSAEELPEGVKAGDYWYNVLDDGTAEITDYVGNDEVISVPSEIEGYTVTSIGYNAFLSSTATEVILPDTVTSLKAYAFRIMRNLENIVIPENVIHIEQGAFEYCMSLNKITLPPHLEYLGHEVLEHTPLFDNPENWENGVLYVGTYLVAADKNLSGVCKIKEGTTLVANYAFKEAKEITEFVLPDSLDHIGEQSFASCSGVKTVTLPENLVSIGNDAFFDCKNLENLILPQNLEKIGWNILDATAFYNNPDNWQDGVLYLNNALISANADVKGEYKIKDGTYIVAGNAFMGVDKLTSLIMPDSVRHIGETSFGWCYNLEYIRFSQNLMKIPEDAFCNCISLEQLNIPDSVIKIGRAAFAGCSSLSDVAVPETVTEIDVYALGYHDGTHPVPRDDFKIYGKTGSAAEEYAKANDIPFEETKEDYKGKVLALLNIEEANYYFEEYEHFATADESGEATPDFVLISAYDSWDASTSVTEYFGEYILHSNNLMHPSEEFGYYIYLPDTNEIYTLSDAFENSIADAYSVFTNNIIGELIGDANNDDKLSIQDATSIQKYLAGLDYIPNNFRDGGFTELFVDYNRDGKINVRDATAIQKHLAGFDRKSLEYTVLDVFEVSSSVSCTEVKTVARTQGQLKAALAKITETDATLDEMFTEEYFQNHSVVVVADIIGASCCSQLVENLNVNGATLTVQRFMDYHEVHNDDINYQCVLIETDKDSLRSVINVNTENLHAIVCY